MNRKSKIIYMTIGWLVFLIIAILIFLFPEEILGPSGERMPGNRATGQLILFLILGPFLIIYCIIVSYLIGKKNKECRALIDKITNLDPSWDHRNLKTRIEETFLKTQEARTKKNMEQAREFLSPGLYDNLKKQMESLTNKKRTNIFKDIVIEKIQLVEVTDFEDDHKDSFLAIVEGQMSDYFISDITQNIVDGHDAPLPFSELWRFTRRSKIWVADEILPKASISILRKLNSFSEELPN